MSVLVIDEVMADGACGEASDVHALETAVRIIVGSVLRIVGVDHVSLYQYMENDDPAYTYDRVLQVVDHTPQQIDALWSSNVRLFVREKDFDSFARRCAVAIRPGCHRGTILADTLRIELAYQPCEPRTIAWTLPHSLQLDPDEHALVIEQMAAGFSPEVSVRFPYRLEGAS